MDKQNILAVLFGVSLAAFAFLISHFGLLDTIELKTLDLRFRMRGPIAIQAPIVVISIDQDSFDELQLPWPWPRTLHAELIRKLVKGGAKIIAFDILFTEPKPDPKEDQALAAAIKEAGRVILAAELTEVASDFGPKTVVNLPIPELREHALGYGLAGLPRNRDGVVRSADLVSYFQDKAFPSFGYLIFQTLARRKAGAKLSLDSTIINFRGPTRTFPTVPYYRVLNDEIDANIFRDKVVLIGAFGESLHDVFPTPFSADRPTAGVEIQANLVDTLLANNPIIPYTGGAHMVVFAILCASTIWISLQLSPLKAFAIVFVLGSLFGLACVYVFVKYRLWFPMTPLLAGVTLSYGGLTVMSYVREQRERLRYRAQFIKYVSPDVVADILENREGLALGGKRRHITVLFSDVRGFTGISEKISPEQVVSFLSQYFAEVTQIVFKHGGTVDKFIGDGMMAVFGAPKAHGDDALRAVKTAIEMIEMVKANGPEWSKILGKEPSIGVGVNSGEAVVGSIGSELRSDYTAIGDTVNLASRLETLTKELGVPILISESTAAEIKDALPLIPLQHVKVVGREAALMVYTSPTFVDRQIDTAEPAEPYVQRHK
jgi:adenylate cyclase